MILFKGALSKLFSERKPTDVHHRFFYLNFGLSLWGSRRTISITGCRRRSTIGESGPAGGRQIVILRGFSTKVGGRRHGERTAEVISWFYPILVALKVEEVFPMAMTRKDMPYRTLIYIAVFLLCLSASPALARVSQNLADRLDLFRERSWVYNNVGEPDSIEWNNTFSTEFELYRISGSSYFDWFFVSYGLDNQVNVLGQIYRKGYMSGYEVCDELESIGAIPVGKTSLGEIYRIQHTRTGKSILVAVQDMKALGKTVVYLLTRDVWERIN